MLALTIIMKKLALLLFCSVLLLGCGGGPGPQPNTTNTTNSTPTQNFTCPDGTIVLDPTLCEADLCPSSCDDGNKCTIDKCGKDTGYECSHTVKIPCCGDGICESGENRDNCLGDCGSCPPDCDDGNPCTLDACGPETGFNCTHNGRSQNMVGCSGYTDFPGYSNVKYMFGTNVPESWRLDEDSKKNEGGVLLLGPEEKQNCSEGSYFEEGLYTDVINGYSIFPVVGNPQTTDAFNGLVFKISNKTSDPGSAAYVLIAPIRYHGTEFVDEVKADIVFASGSGSEITLLGATMVNMTFGYEEKKNVDDLLITLHITGFSNRSGEWEPEAQTHQYFIYQGRTYMLGFVETKQKYDPVKFRLFPWRGCQKEPFLPSIAVYLMPTVPTYLLGDYVSESLSQVGNVSGYSLLDSGDQTLDGNAAKYYAVSFVSQGFPIKQKTVISYRKGRAYKLEYTALRGSYDRDYLLFDSAIKGFKILPPPSNCKQKTCLDGECAIVALKGCCGNGFCESGEECFSCPQDCGTCSSTYKPLDADAFFLSDEPKYYSTFNCENYIVRVRINNPLNEPMTVFAEGALRLRSEADSTCRAAAHSSVDCIATMSGAFGDLYAKDTVERKLVLFGYGGYEIEKGEILYAKTLRFNVTYDTSWRGPYCFQFYCVPGVTKRFDGRDYTITGIEDYRGDILIGNWWCHANRTETAWDGAFSGTSEIYYNQFYNMTCVVSYGVTGAKQGENCYNVK